MYPNVSSASHLAYQGEPQVRPLEAIRAKGYPLEQQRHARGRIGGKV
jgi:hypothetical protein